MSVTDLQELEEVKGLIMRGLLRATTWLGPTATVGIPVNVGLAPPRRWEFQSTSQQWTLGS